MPSEHSAGAVVFRKEDGKILYLLVHYEEGHWGASKGHIEKGETLEETTRRELQEETGITDAHFIEGFKESTSYFFYAEGKRVFKAVTFLLIETHTSEVKLSFEHTGYAWLPFEEALEKVTYKDEKGILKKADEFILASRMFPS
jgi:bis(5'-nucleosidyl)-tetraphosphatase